MFVVCVVHSYYDIYGYFHKNFFSSWDQIFKESKTSINIFSDSSDLEN